MSKMIQSAAVWLTISTAALCGGQVTPKYSLIRIGQEFPQYSSAWAINDSSQIVVNAGEGFHGYVWSPQGSIGLEQPGDNECFAGSISQTGAVSGFFSRPGMIDEHAFVWQNGERIDLDPQGYWSQCLAISPDGTMLGGTGRLTAPSCQAAFSFSPSTQAFGPCGSTVFAVSNDGLFAGGAPGRDSAPAVFLWKDGAEILTGAGRGVAWGISPDGKLITGEHYGSSGLLEAFVWDGQQLRMLDYGSARSINDLGIAVGTNYTSRGCVFTPEGSVELRDLVQLYWEIYFEFNWPMAINNLGQIVGSGYQQSNPQAFLLTCWGDIDGDAAVDLTDLAMLLARFGIDDSDPSYLPAADLDGSGGIDLSDVASLLSVYGTVGCN